MRFSDELISAAIENKKTEDALTEIDKLWSSASQRVAGLIHGKNVARSREEFLEAMLESWPDIRENLNRNK